MVFSATEEKAAKNSSNNIYPGRNSEHYGKDNVNLIEQEKKQGKEKSFNLLADQD